MKSSNFRQYIGHCHMTKGHWGVHMAIDWPLGRLILVKQLLVCCYRSGAPMLTLLVQSISEERFGYYGWAVNKTHIRCFIVYFISNRVSVLHRWLAIAHLVLYCSSLPPREFCLWRCLVIGCAPALTRLSSGMSLYVENYGRWQDNG